jgi:catalase
MRYAINQFVVIYWPIRFRDVPPNRDHAVFNFEEKVAGIKARLNAAKFKEYFNQAQTFVNSLTQPEWQHLVSALAFKL